MTVVKSAPPVSRRERAARTRLRIAGAAADLFASVGYAATTIDAVARRAGVAVQTVYFVFHTKPLLLVETLKIAGGGAEGASDVMARAWIQAVIAASDGPRRLALIAEHGTKIYRRLAPLWPAVLAALGEPEVREAWSGVVRGRREGMGRITDLMAARGELRSGLEPAVAADILFGIHRHELYLAFTDESGWSFDRYRAWTFAVLCRELLPPEVATEALASDSPTTVDLEFAKELQDFAF
jgi:AcrR family transcriptional regulator